MVKFLCLSYEYKDEKDNEYHESWTNLFVILIDRTHWNGERNFHKASYTHPRDMSDHEDHGFTCSFVRGM